jgi:hypothetical protein
VALLKFHNECNSKSNSTMQSDDLTSMTQPLQLGLQFLDGFSNFSHFLFVFCLARFWLLGQQSFSTFWAATPAGVLRN